MGETFDAVKDALVEEQRQWNREQKTAWQTSGSWFKAVPVVVAIGAAVALIGSGILDTVGGVTILVGVILLFVALWKHIGAGGDDFGTAAGAGGGS